MRTLLEFYTGTLIAGIPLNLITYYFLLVTCLAYAFSRGGAPERIAAAVLATSSVLSLLAISDPRISFTRIETGVLIVDLLSLAAFVILAIRAERYWPLWVAALQVLTVAAHGIRLVDPDMLRRAYAFLIVVWSYPMIFLIIVGTRRHRQRLARFGRDEAWSPGGHAPR